MLTPDGDPYEGDPRYVMKRALARAQDLGFDDFYIGPELEFFLFKDDQGTEVLDKGGYFDLTTLDAARTSAATACSRCASSASRWSTPTTRSAPRSTRSTCATPAVSRCRTTR